MKGIYQIKNKVNNKVYIGSSVNVKERWRLHKYELLNNIHKNEHLLNSWNKYGEEDFEFELLMLCEKSLLLLCEQWFLDNMKPEYNIAPFANSGMRGRHHTKESKIKMSEARKGKTHSEITKEKMSKSRIGKVFTKEHKNNMSKIHSGENNSNSKLIEERVLMIRRMYLIGKYTQKELGKMFKVNRATIGQVVTKKTWKEV